MGRKGEAEKKERSDTLTCSEHSVYLPATGARKMVTEVL